MIRILLVLLLVLSSGIVQSQPRNKKFNGRGLAKQGNCFCNSAAKKGGSFYFGAIGAWSNSTFKNEVESQQETYFKYGLQGGLNFTKHISLQIGAMLSEPSSIVPKAGYYDKAEYEFLDIPIEAVFRYPIDDSRVVPFATLGVNNNILLGGNQTRSLDGATESLPKEYNESYMKVSVGAMYVFLEQASVFVSPYFQSSFSGFSGDFPTSSYVNQWGIKFGINYHISSE